MSLLPLKQTELRTLRLLFGAFVVLGVAAGVLTGGSLLGAVVGGGVMGGLYFMPLILLYLVYLFGKRRGTAPA
ncbi:hypothetical protein [Haloarcula onubensis]|uniref:Uncharacterized protein n=1 Tax=Haloarcula onubensis TaxID=2950539 RepID=A0ABU2FQ89_9EURY|nr:hypothetical protein [Halomicroarcula sp. S3CR25-11]MDS0282913.1 hypothetical protein [Halomicroarcula sp. S3CR25-11]